MSRTQEEEGGGEQALVWREGTDSSSLGSNINSAPSNPLRSREKKKRKKPLRTPTTCRSIFFSPSSKVSLGEQEIASFSEL